MPKYSYMIKSRVHYVKLCLNCAVALNIDWRMWTIHKQNYFLIWVALAPDTDAVIGLWCDRDKFSVMWWMNWKLWTLHISIMNASNLFASCISTDGIQRNPRKPMGLSRALIKFNPQQNYSRPLWLGRSCKMYKTNEVMWLTYQETSLPVNILNRICRSWSAHHSLVLEVFVNRL